MEEDKNTQPKNDEPIDPSNTSDIGQNVSQGVISPKEGITEQSTQWQNEQDSKDEKNTLLDPKAEQYLKHPSPEDRGD